VLSADGRRDGPTRLCGLLRFVLLPLPSLSKGCSRMTNPVSRSSQHTQLSARMPRLLCRTIIPIPSRKRLRLLSPTARARSRPLLHPLLPLFQFPPLRRPHLSVPLRLPQPPLLARQRLLLRQPQPLSRLLELVCWARLSLPLFWVVLSLSCSKLSKARAGFWKELMKGDDPDFEMKYASWIHLF
jgi:hypothetical protein